MHQGPSKSGQSGIRDSAIPTYSTDDPSLQPSAPGFAPRCLSIDLEVGRQDGRIHRFAAVRGDTGESFHHRGGDLRAGLAKLDRMADGVAFLVGHNLIDFDSKILAANFEVDGEAAGGEAWRAWLEARVVGGINRGGGVADTTLP